MSDSLDGLSAAVARLGTLAASPPEPAQPEQPPPEQEQEPRQGNRRRRQRKGGAGKGGGGGKGGVSTGGPGGNTGEAGAAGSGAAKPPPPLSPMPALPKAALQRPRLAVAAFGEGTWVAADWPEARTPRSYSGFFLPLLYSGLASADGGAFGALLATTPEAHFSGRPVATADSIGALQPLWAAVFSHWPAWVAAVRAAVDAGVIAGALGRGVSAKAAWLIPTRFAPSTDGARLEEFVRAFGCVPHLRPAAQNDAIEAALGPMETSRFYASIASLFTPREAGAPSSSAGAP